VQLQSGDLILNIFTHQVKKCSQTYIASHFQSLENATFFSSVLDFIKGTGFLERTPLFIGWYPAKLMQSPASYSIHLSYSLTIVFAYAVSILYVVRAYGRFLRERIDFLNFDYLFSNIIFKGWDFNISNASAAVTEKKLMVMELKAAQTEINFLEEKENRSRHQTNMLLVTRIGVNLVVAIMILSGWISIYFVVTKVKGETFWAEYAATMTVSFFNNVYPPIFFA